MNFGEKLRRTINSLDSHTELRNLIGEEEDVAKAYENIVKQNKDKEQFLKKWGAKETEFMPIFQIVLDHSPQHNQIILDFSKQYRVYITGLKEILNKTEKVHHEEKHVKELEEKVAKKKASETTLNEAKNHRDVLLTELQRLKENTIKESFRNLTKAYCDMYFQGLQHMNQQLGALGGPGPSHGQPPPGNFPPQHGQPPPGNFPPPQHGQPPPGNFPPQQQHGQNFPPQSGNLPPQQNYGQPPPSNDPHQQQSFPPQQNYGGPPPSNDPNQQQNFPPQQNYGGPPPQSSDPNAPSYGGPPPNYSQAPPPQP